MTDYYGCLKVGMSLLSINGLLSSNEVALNSLLLTKHLS